MMSVNIIFKSFIFLWTITFSLCMINLNGDLHPSWNFLPKENCGIGALEERIVGGQQAILGQYPWIARLGYDLSDDGNVRFLCAGTLINRWHVLTAKHCLVGGLGEAIAVVRLGEHLTKEEIDCYYNVCAPPVQDIPVEYAKRFEDLEDKPDITYGDIGIIKLVNPAEYNDFVQPICLPTGNVISQIDELTAIGTPLEVAGWGVKDISTNKSSDALLYVTVPVVDREVCQQTYPGQRIDGSQICAGTGTGKDSCVGDSGGPLMRAVALNSSPKYYLFGVVSYGMTNCGQGAAVYTSVIYYMNWILNQIECLN